MRVLLKISGEALKDEQNIANSMLETVYEDIINLRKNNNEVIIVVGGGNFWRGRNSLEIDNDISDKMGMLSTVMNALAISSYLNEHDIKAVAKSAFNIESIIDKLNEEDEILLKDNILVLGGGTGHVGCSTDLAVVDKAIKLKADMIIMAKNVDGIYDKDPKKFKDAKKFNVLTHEEFFNFQKNTDSYVMDLEASKILNECKIPLYLYDAKDKDGINKILNNQNTGTTIITKENICIK